MQKKSSRNLGIALLFAGVALTISPFLQSATDPFPAYKATGTSGYGSGSGSGSGSSSGSVSGSGSATTFRTMSQNIIQASSGFNSLWPFGRGISNGNLAKVNASSLAIDSVTTFDGGGPYTSYTPPPQQAYAPPVSVYTTPSDTNAYPYYHDVGRDSFPKFDENEVKSVKAEPVSTFAIDVDTSSYSFVRRNLNEGHLPQKDAVRVEEMINYFPYGYAKPVKDADPFQPTVAVYDCPWKPGDKLVHIGIKGYDIAERPRSNIVFLIDTSGSMGEPDKLPLLVNAFKMMLDSLQPDDMVSIVTYAGNASALLQPTPAAEKTKIIAVLDSLHADGCTYGSQGIKTAYDLAEQNFIKDGNNRIILATDGDFNVGITNQDELKKFIETKRDKGIFLSAMGFGMGDYHDDTMQTLAQNGNGSAAYIDNMNEARKVLVDESSSTLYAIAKDVKIQVEFNPAKVQEYRLIGYETRHLKKEEFNNDRIAAGEVGAGHAVTAIYEVTPVGAHPLVDDLRYGKEDVGPPAPEKASTAFKDEYAFLKIRYKQPDQDVSKLMTRAITVADEHKFNDLPDDIRFAAAVAEFGQLLRDSKYAGTFKWNDVANMAEKARGKDEFGYRAEFVNLVRLTKSEWSQQN